MVLRPARLLCLLFACACAFAGAAGAQDAPSAPQPPQPQQSPPAPATPPQAQPGATPATSQLRRLTDLSPPEAAAPVTGPRVALETSMGRIVLEL